MGRGARSEERVRTTAGQSQETFISGDSLARLRADAELSQAALAEAVASSEVTIRRWEKAGIPPETVGILVRLAHLLRCTVDELLGLRPNDALVALREENARLRRENDGLRNAHEIIRRAIDPARRARIDAETDREMEDGMGT